MRLHLHENDPRPIFRKLLAGLYQRILDRCCGCLMRLDLALRVRASHQAVRKRHFVIVCFALCAVARINETERANALSAALTYSVNGRDLVIDFPVEMKTKKLSAQVLLYCTADNGKDIQKLLSTDNGRLHFPLPSANKGLHELRVTWVVNDTSYFFKHKIMLP